MFPVSWFENWDPPWGPRIEFLRLELKTTKQSWSEKLEGDNKCEDEDEAASESSIGGLVIDKKQTQWIKRSGGRSNGRPESC